MHPFKLISLFTALSLCLVACSDKPEQAAPPAGYAPEIDVAEVPSQMMANWHVFTTRLESPQSVKLKPRVTGIIESVEFTEGSRVQAGDLLFKLDDRIFKAEVNSLQASVKSAKTALEQAKNESERATRLRARNAISAEEAEAKVALSNKLAADLAAVQARLQAAQLNLEFTQVTAPFSGRISSAFLMKGHAVNANQSELTHLISTDVLFAYFDIDERTWHSEFAEVDLAANLTAETKIPVSLSLAGQTATQRSIQTPILGELDFIDNSINPNTGTLRVRARFNNSDSRLIAGAFARISIAPAQFNEQVIIPDRAVGTDLKNRFVLVVDADNKLTYRLVELGKRYGEFRVITKGLTKGERIAVNGPAKVGPGMPITPRKVEITLPEISNLAKLALSSRTQAAIKKTAVEVN